MLETVREFGIERLDAGEGEVIRRFHASWCRSLAFDAELELRGPDQARWHDRLEREVANLQQAMEWAIDHDIETALWIGGLLCEFWLVRGRLPVIQDALERALASGQGAPAARARGMVTAAWIRFAQGDFDSSVQLSRDAVEHYRAMDDGTGLFRALLAEGHSLMLRSQESPGIDASGLDSAEERFREALANAHKRESVYAIALARQALGALAQARGELAAAADHLGFALSSLESVGDWRNAG